MQKARVPEITRLAQLRQFCADREWVNGLTNELFIHREYVLLNKFQIFLPFTTEHLLHRFRSVVLRSTTPLHFVLDGTYRICRGGFAILGLCLAGRHFTYGTWRPTALPVLFAVARTDSSKLVNLDL